MNKYIMTCIYMQFLIFSLICMMDFLHHNIFPAISDFEIDTYNATESAWQFYGWLLNLFMGCQYPSAKRNCHLMEDRPFHFWIKCATKTVSQKKSDRQGCREQPGWQVCRTAIRVPFSTWESPCVSGDISSQSALKTTSCCRATSAVADRKSVV